MRVMDRGMRIDLPDADPRAVRIRAILFQQPAAQEPLPTLWTACSSQQRQVLAALAEAGELLQQELERRLGVNGIELRGRHSGLARIAKRLGVAYPIRSNGGRRDSRRFWLDETI